MVNTPTRGIGDRTRWTWRLPDISKKIASYTPQACRELLQEKALAGRAARCLTAGLHGTDRRLLAQELPDGAAACTD